MRVWGLCSPLGLGCADMCTLYPVRVSVCEGLCTLEPVRGRVCEGLCTL